MDSDDVIWFFIMKYIDNYLCIIIIIHRYIEMCLYIRNNI